MKLLLIGLDGATWNLIKPWAEEGKLPTFKKLMENGVWGELESTFPPWTSPAWESLSTGKNPASLGIGMFLIKKNGEYIPSSEIFRNIPKFWDLLAENGFKICVANVPPIDEPYKTNGIIVVGVLYKDEKKLTYPESLMKELNEVCGKYEVDIVKSDGKKLTYVPPKEKIFEECEKLLENHHKAFSYLLFTKEWDFAFIVFVTPDRLQHKLWENKEKMLKHFQKIDSKLSELLKINSNIIIISDHGFGKNEISFRINEWLIKEGYLKVKGPQQFGLVKVLRFFKVLKLLEKIFRRLPSGFRGKITSRIVKHIFEVDIDWSKTMAFSYGGMGDIFINLKERYSHGIVDLSEYETLREEIIKKLSQVKLPNGKKPKISIFKKEEIYNNSVPEDSLPDIIILPEDDGFHSFSPSIGYGEIVSFSVNETGNHRLNGIFLAYGPDIKSTGKQIKGVKIYDIAPTILHMFGVPIPKDVDGKVLLEIFKEESEIFKRKPRYVSESERVKVSVSEAIKELEVLE